VCAYRGAAGLRGISARSLGLICIGLVAGRAAAALPGDGYPDYLPVGGLTGELHSMGTDVMDGLTVAWLDIFRKAHPQVEATMEARGANTAIPGLINGASQLAPISRAISPVEAESFAAKFGYPPTEFRVACGTYDGFGLSPPVVLFVHRDNPLNALTLGQVEEIYARGGNLTNWGQLDLTGEWADKPIAVWGLRLPNGTATFFQDAAMHGRDFRPTMIVRPTADPRSRSAQRAPNGGVQAFVDILEGIADDRYAIGYAAPGYPNPKVKMLAVALTPTATPVAPKREAVASRTYPLCRFIYIYVNRAPDRPLDPCVREFLRAVLSQQGQAVVAQRSGFLPLPAPILQEELAKLD